MPDPHATYLVAKTASSFDPDQIRALVIDLIAERAVDRPCALVVGATIPVPLPLYECRGKKAGPFRAEGRSMTIRYAGGNSAQLLEALDKAPLGEKDVMVWFQNFVDDAKGFPTHIQADQPIFMWGIGLVILAKPRELPTNSKGQVFLVAEGEGGPYAHEMRGSKLEKILMRRLGTLTVANDQTPV